MSDPASQGRSSPPALSLQGITGVPPGATARAPGRTNGLTNGMTNGIGRTNGLSRPRGRTNGLVAPKGRTNGLVNGHGFINGLPLRRSRFGVVASSDYRRAGAFLATSFLLMILFSYLLGVPGPAPSRFAMDGNFSDWATIPKYVDGVDNSLPAHVDLLDFAVVREDWRVFVYGRTRGPLFPGGATSSVYVLVDNPNTTGYSFHGLDVDYLAEAWGWGGQLRETSLRAWGGGPDRDNATSFSTVGGFDAASSGSEFELMLTDAELDLTAAPALKFTVVTRSDDAVDVSVSVGLSPGALSVDQRPLTEVVASNSTVIELTLTAYVADVDIRGLVFDHTGGGTVVIPNPQFRLSAGAARTEGIGIDVTGVPAGSLIGLRLRDVDAFIAGTNVRVPVTVTGPGARLYAQSIPAGHVIDGVFADWTAPSVDPNDAVPASVDILEYGFNVSSDAFFYVGTRGDVLAGAVLPERRAIPTASPSDATT